MIINLIFKSNEKTLIYAAEELKTYLSLLDIDLKFSMNSIGKYNIELAASPNLADYGLPRISNPYLDDQYHIKFDSNGGHIIGSNYRSVLLGVYRYLYHIGFRFLYPDKRYDYIPNLKSFDQLFLEINDTASKRHRGVCIEGANSIQNIIDFIDWMPKAGFNSFFIQFRIPYTFMSRWYNHEFNPYLPEEGFDESKIFEYSKLIDSALEKRSLLHHRVGHGWTCETIGYPSLGWMNTDAKINDNIRPFLAKINGKRELFHGVPMNTNLCYSNTQVIERFTDEVVNYAKEHSKIDYLHIWIADEFNNICECDHCVKTTPADQYVHILNIIDEKLSNEGLSTHLVFLLYQELLWAPKTERLQNPERFTLMFAPITRTFEKSYPVGISNSTPPEYQRNKITLPTNIEENISFLKEWQNIFAGDSFVYDYPLGRAHYGDFGYAGIAKIISSDIKNLSHLHMNGYISCQELRVGLPNTLPNYVMGYTLFHSDTAFQDLQLDYYKHAYGEDFPYVLDYLEDLSKLSSPDYYNGKGPRNNSEKHSCYEKLMDRILSFQPFIRKNKTKFDTLENNVKANDSVHKFFWNLLDYHAEYSLRLTKALVALSSNDCIAANEYWNEFHQFICSNENAYQASLDVYRVTEVGTKYTGFQL